MEPSLPYRIIQLYYTPLFTPVQPVQFSVVLHAYEVSLAECFVEDDGCGVGEV